MSARSLIFFTVIFSGLTGLRSIFEINSVKSILKMDRDVILKLNTKFFYVNTFTVVKK